MRPAAGRCCLAIRFSALDYLLKPVDEEELKLAVDRYLQKQHEQKQLQELYRNFLSNAEKDETKNYRLALNTSTGIRLVKPSEIIRCQAQNNYTQFYLTDKKIITTSKTLKEYEELLAEYNFVRVHKAHLVNIYFVHLFNSSEDTLLLKDGAKVEVSRRRRHEVMETLKQS